MRTSKRPAGATGPRTKAGKLRSSRNSLKHGLSALDLFNHQSERIEVLAKKLRNGSTDPDIEAAATKAAKARAFLEKISAVRRAIIDRTFQDASSGKFLPMEETRAVALQLAADELDQLYRYECRAFGQWRRAKALLEAISWPQLV